MRYFHTTDSRRVTTLAGAPALFVAMLAMTTSGCVVWKTSGPMTVGPIAMTPAAIDAARADIVAMMTRSAASWNRGDLDAFVGDYDPSPATTFVGSKGLVRGVAAIQAVYAPRFAPGGVRDSLSFENVEVDLLAPDAAHVIAYYRLMRGDSTTARGPTSLVLRKRAAGWKITHDHSS